MGKVIDGFGHGLRRLGEPGCAGGGEVDVRELHVLHVAAGGLESARKST